MNYKRPLIDLINWSKLHDIEYVQYDCGDLIITRIDDRHYGTTERRAANAMFNKLVEELINGTIN